MHWVSNAIVVLLAVGAVWVTRYASRDRFWRENAKQLWRRRPVAIVVIGVYVFIALLDSIAWVDAASEANALTSGRPRPSSTASSGPRPSMRQATRRP